MKWISFDWDYITGDRSGREIGACARKCSRHCSGVASRGKENGIYSSPRMLLNSKRLLRITKLLQRVSIMKAVFRDSHASIVRFLHKGDKVFHFDYHEDRYEPIDNKGYYGRLACGNWVTLVEKRGITVYDLEDRESRVPNGKYSLFVCWSRPYTNKRYDGALLRLLGKLACGVDFQAARA